MSKSNIDYNAEPVHYCTHCLSLKVMRMAGMDELCFCDKCGSTDIDTANIKAWELMYQARYNTNKKL
jgi:ribosomal protein L37AE/L43A